MRTYSRPIPPTPPIKDQLLKTWLEKTASVEDINLVSSFSNGWSNAGGAYRSVGYYKDSFGIVRLEGRLTGGTSGAAAFTLPNGYRPLGDCAFLCADPAGVSGHVVINASGVVTPTSGSATPAVNLDQISFRAA